MDGQQNNICGYAVIESDCETHEIKNIAALQFQVDFIDAFGNLCASMKKPKIEVGLFEVPENIQFGITVDPSGISNLILTQPQPHDFVIRLILSTSETVKTRAYANILKLAEISLNFIDILARRKGLTYSSNLGITNSNTSTLTVTLKKRI